MDNEVDPSEIPEVQQFMEIQEYYEKFKAQNPEFFRVLDEVQEQFNTRLDAAEKAVRRRKVSCGPFQVHSEYFKYNADALWEATGEETFHEVGGKSETVRKLSVDKTKLELAIGVGRIPEDVANTVRTHQVTYRKIDKLRIL
jgi:hypothetical protein